VYVNSRVRTLPEGEKKHQQMKVQQRMNNYFKSNYDLCVHKYVIIRMRSKDLMTDKLKVS